MSINSDPNPFSFEMPGLPLPQEQDPATNQAAQAGKLSQGMGTAGTKAEIDTLEAGGKSVSAQQFASSLTSNEQAALNTVTAQLPFLPQPDLAVSGMLLSQLSQELVNSGLITFSEDGTLNFSDSVNQKRETGTGSSSSTASDSSGATGVMNAPVQGRSNQSDQDSSFEQGTNMSNDSAAAAAAEGSAKAPAGSDWFKPTGYVTAMINMISYVNQVTREETTLLKLTIAMINIMWDMTLTAAQLQRDIGEKEAEAYQIKAAMAAVQMAVAIVTVAATVGTMAVAAKGAGGVTNAQGVAEDTAGSKAAQMLLQSGVFNQVGTIVNSGTEMIGNLFLASNVMDKAELEAALKEEEGRIQQIRMLLDQMIQSLNAQSNLVDQFNRYIADISKQRQGSLTATGQN